MTTGGVSSAVARSREADQLVGTYPLGSAPTRSGAAAAMGWVVAGLSLTHAHAHNANACNRANSVTRDPYLSQPSPERQN